MASLDAFFIFSKFWFSRLSVLWVKGQKMVENDEKFCLTLYLRNCTSCDCGFCYTCVKWYLQQFFFHFFKILIFRVFQSSSINAKSKFWCVPHLLHMCVIFTDYALLTFCKIKLVKYWLKVLFFHCLLKNLFLSLFFTSRYMVYVRWYCAKFHKVKSSNIHIAWQF